MYRCRFCEMPFSTANGRNIHEGQKHHITEKVAKDFMLENYVKKKMTIREISSLTGFGEWHITKALKAHNIPVRTQAESLKVRGSLKGEKHPLYGTKGGFYGKKHTQETIRKMSIARKTYLKSHPEAIEKIKKHQTKDVKENKNPNWKGGRYESCKMCSKKFWKQPSNKSVCCSFECAMNLLKLEGKLKLQNNPNWRGGVSYEPYPFEFNSDLKLIILKMDGAKCKLCGGTKRLSAHHIDYNKDNCDLSNLITLCTKCNSKVNFHRELWKSRLIELVKHRTKLDLSRNKSTLTNFQIG